MTKQAFEQLCEEVCKGNNQALAPLQAFQTDCIRMLRIKSGNRCDAAHAYDIFIDAIMDFRTNVLKNKVLYQNISAYLKRICWNKWLAASRQKQRWLNKEEEIKRRLYTEEESMEDQTEEQYKEQLQQIKKSMQLLSDKCRAILRLAILEERTMSDIAIQLKLANANVAKTSKSRCYKKFILLIKDSDHDQDK